METIIEFLKKTPEYQNFGMNALTVSAIGATAFTFLQAWGVRKQGNRIWNTKEGESVSVMFIGYSMFYFFAFLIYGAERLSITMTLNGLLALFHIRVMRGLLKFKGFTNIEWIWLFGFAILMVPGMLLLRGGEQEIFLLVLLFGIIFTLTRQTYEVWRAKSAGALEPKYLYVFLITNVFWFVYAMFVGAWPLMIFNPMAFILFTVNLALYYRYR